MRSAVLLLLLLLSAPAAAQGTAAPAASAPGEPEGVPDAQYLSQIGQGLTAMAAQRDAQALAAFRQAVQTNPSRPEGVCFLAEVQRRGGDLTAALDTFNACLRVARAASDARWTARAMQGVAGTLELMPQRLEEARRAWQEYARFAESASSVANPEMGRARITAIDQVIELERVTAEVRQRIAERERFRAEQAAHPSAPAAPPAQHHGHHERSH